MTTTATHPHHSALHHDPQAAALAVHSYEEARLRELSAKQHWRARAWVAGRVLIGLLFVAGAIGKLITFKATEAAMSDFGLQITGVLLTMAIAIEGIAGAMVLLGYKTRGAALTLAAWLVTLTVVVHGNVTLDANRVQAFNNLAIIAALLFVYAHGAGQASLDQRAMRREAQQP
jgi:putative oxidoreductase